MHEEAAPITVYVSAWKLLGLALVWTGVAAVLIWALKGGLVTAILLLPIFAYGVISAVYRLFVRAPVLVIDREGIYHNVLGVRPQRIAWAEIRSVGLYAHRPTPFRFLSLRYFVVFPKDPEAFLAQQTGIVRWLLRCYMASAPAPIMVPQHILPISVDWIAQQARVRFSPQLKSHRISVDEKPRRF